MAKIERYKNSTRAKWRHKLPELCWDDEGRGVGSGEEDCRTNLDLDWILSYERHIHSRWIVDL
jgi:hypothetical protein